MMKRSFHFYVLLASFLLAVASASLAPRTVGQGRPSEKDELFSQFTEKRRSEPIEAHRIAEMYLAKFGKSVDENTQYIREWVLAYKAVAGVGGKTPSESLASPTASTSGGTPVDLVNTTWQQKGGEEGKRWAHIFTFRAGGRFQWEYFNPDGGTSIRAGTWRRLGTDVFATILDPEGNPRESIQATLRNGLLSGVVKRSGNEVLQFKMQSEEVEIQAKAEPSLAEYEMWGKVKESTRAVDYHHFLKAFPNGAFAEMARAKMEEIGDSVWNEVKRSRDAFTYRSFLSKNPDSPFAAAAKERMNKLTASLVAWEQIKASKNPEDLADYIARFPANLRTPDSDKLVIYRWRKFVYEGQTQSVMDELNRDLEVNPRFVPALLTRARAQFGAGKLEKANSDAVQVLNLLSNPQNADDFRDRCNAELVLRKFDEAMSSCNKAIELDPSDYFSYLVKGLIWFNKKEYDSGLKDETKAVEMSSSPLSYAYRARTYFAKGETDLAIADYTKALELDPKFAGAFTFRGEAYMFTNDQILAIRDFTKAIELTPKAIRALYRRATLLYQTKDFDAALADLNAVSKLGDETFYTPRSYNLRGYIYLYKKNDAESALRDFKKAIASGADFSEPHFQLGYICYTRKDYDGAILNYTKAIEIDRSEYPIYYRHRADAYEAKDQKKLAKADRQKAEELEKQQKNK